MHVIRHIDRHMDALYSDIPVHACIHMPVYAFIMHMPMHACIIHMPVGACIMLSYEMSACSPGRLDLGYTFLRMH